MERITYMDEELSLESTERMCAPLLSEGTEIGRLLLLSKFVKPGTRHDYWKCKCQCGAIKSIRADSLRNGRTKSCGCAQHTSTLGRRNQKSSLTVPGTPAFTIYAYMGHKERPDSNQNLRRLGFCLIAPANGAQGDYYLSRCVYRDIKRGTVNELHERGLNILHRTYGRIGPRDGMSIPAWSARYGVAFRVVMTASRAMIYDAHKEKREQQSFKFKDL